MSRRQPLYRSLLLQFLILTTFYTIGWYYSRALWCMSSSTFAAQNNRMWPAWPTPQICTEKYLTRYPPAYWGQANASDPFDQILYEKYFNNWCNGVFVDVGANDGETYSQTAFFQRSRQWAGVCIEPQPERYSELLRTRPHCISFNVAISSLHQNNNLTFLKLNGSKHLNMFSGFKHSMSVKHMDTINKKMAKDPNSTLSLITVPVTTLGEVLASVNLTKVDYLNVDTEGSELEVRFMLTLKCLNSLLLHRF